MTLLATLDRDTTELVVTVECTVEPYAQAVGIPDEFARRFAGRSHVSILSVVDETGRAVELDGHEREYVGELAVENNSDDTRGK